MEIRLGYAEVKAVVGIVKTLLGKTKPKIRWKDTFPESWKRKGK